MLNEKEVDEIRVQAIEDILRLQYNRASISVVCLAVVMFCAGTAVGWELCKYLL